MLIPIHLTWESDVDFFDYSPVQSCSTAVLGWVEERLPYILVFHVDDYGLPLKEEFCWCWNGSTFVKVSVPTARQIFLNNAYVSNGSLGGVHVRYIYNDMIPTFDDYKSGLTLKNLYDAFDDTPLGTYDF